MGDNLAVDDGGHLVLSLGFGHRLNRDLFNRYLSAVLALAEPCLVAVKLIEVAAIDDCSYVGMTLMEHIHSSLVFGRNGTFSDDRLLNLILLCGIEGHNRLFLLVQLLSDFRLQGYLNHLVCVESVEGDSVGKVILYHTVDDFDSVGYRLILDGVVGQLRNFLFCEVVDEVGLFSHGLHGEGFLLRVYN